MEITQPEGKRRLTRRQAISLILAPGIDFAGHGRL